MRNRADARYTNLLSFEIRRSFNFGPHHDPLQAFIDNAGDHHGIAPVEGSVDKRVSGRAGCLDVVRKQSADCRSSLPCHDHLHIDAVLAKQSLLFGDPDGAMKSAHRAEPHAHLFLSERRRANENYKNSRRIDAEFPRHCRFASPISLPVPPVTASSSLSPHIWPVAATALLYCSTRRKF